MQEQCDAFEKSFPALDTGAGLGEGTEQQRAKSLCLATANFGVGEGGRCPAGAGLMEHMLSTCSQPRVLRAGFNPPAAGDSRAAVPLQVTVPPLSLGMP